MISEMKEKNIMLIYLRMWGFGSLSALPGFNPGLKIPYFGLKINLNCCRDCDFNDSSKLITQQAI